MTQQKRRKVCRYRGSKTHGGGSMKKRRGAGHRGGRGNAGSGKRGDSRKPSYWKSSDFGKGKHGFFSVTRKAVETLNVSELQADLELLVEAGHASKSGDKYSVDLEAAGVDKLLGTGRISAKMDVKVFEASSKAVEKVKAAGGSVKLSGARVEEPAKDASTPAEE
jgi:large subunit ribosomal protein L15